MGPSLPSGKMAVSWQSLVIGVYMIVDIYSCFNVIFVSVSVSFCFFCFFVQFYHSFWGQPGIFCLLFVFFQIGKVS